MDPGKDPGKFLGLGFSKGEEEEKCRSTSTKCKKKYQI